MKVNLNYNGLLILVLSYPIVLGSIFVFNVSPFFITAPYFFILIALLYVKIIQKRSLKILKSNVLDICLGISLLLISLLNFSTLRLSLPIFFSFYIFSLSLYVGYISMDSRGHLRQQVKLYLFIYTLLSIIFYYFLDFTHMEIGDRFMGFTGSPTTYAAIMAVIYIIADNLWQSNMKKRIILYLLIFTCIYLSKTRLVLIFLLLYPPLLFFIRKKALNYSLVFIISFLILFFIYPLYTVVVDFFPGIISIRYEDQRDASFGLRSYLYSIAQMDFFSGSVWDILFGKGNEYSRLLVIEKVSKDIYPHNDFIRIIIDWGILGSCVLFYLIYRLAKNNIVSLMIAILYLILFYSNMIFNLFLISVLILYSINVSTNKSPR